MVRSQMSAISSPDCPQYLAVAFYFVWSGKAEKEMQAVGEAALADGIKLVSRIEP